MANAGILGQVNALSNIGELLPSGSYTTFSFFSDDARTTLYIDSDNLVISEMPTGVYSLGIYEQTFSKTKNDFAGYLKSKFALSTNPDSDSVQVVFNNIISYAYNPAYYNPNYPYERAHLSKDGNMVATICGLKHSSGHLRVGLMCLFKVDGVWDLANSFFTEIEEFGSNGTLRSGLTVSTDGDFLAVGNRLFKVGATTLTEIELPPTIDQTIVAISVDAKIIVTQEATETPSGKNNLFLYQLQNQSYTLFQRIVTQIYPRGAFGAFSKSGEFFYMNGRVFRKSKNNTYIGFLNFNPSVIDSSRYYTSSAHRPSISDTGCVLWFLGSGVYEVDFTKKTFVPTASAFICLSVSSTVTGHSSNTIRHTPTAPDGVVYKVPDDVKIATVKVFSEYTVGAFLFKTRTTGFGVCKIPDNSCIVLSSGDCVITRLEHNGECIVTGIEHV